MHDNRLEQAQAAYRLGADSGLRVGQQRPQQRGVRCRAGLGKPSDRTQRRFSGAGRSPVMLSDIDAEPAGRVPGHRPDQRRVIIQARDSIAVLTGPDEPGQRHHPHLSTNGPGQATQNVMLAGPDRLTAGRVRRPYPNPHVRVSLGAGHQVGQTQPAFSQDDVEHEPPLPAATRSQQPASHLRRRRRQRRPCLGDGEATS